MKANEAITNVEKQIKNLYVHFEVGEQLLACGEMIQEELEEANKEIHQEIEALETVLESAKVLHELVNQRGYQLEDEYSVDEIFIDSRDKLFIRPDIAKKIGVIK